MKKLFIIFTFLLVWIMIGNNVYAAEFQQIFDFSDWDGYSSQSTFDPSLIQPNETNVDINIYGIDDQYIYTSLYQTNASPDKIGMLATINISSANGNMEAGIMDSLGKVGNERLQVYICLRQWDGKKDIEFKISLADLTTGARQQLTTGVIGESDGAWNFGDDIMIGIMRTENDFWFYAEGYPGFVKWTHADNVEDYIFTPEIFGYTDAGSGNDVAAKVSNVTIIKSY
jgi:hypothetical protein